MTLLVALPVSLFAAQVLAPISFDPIAPRLGDLAIVYVKNGDPKITRGTVRVFGYEFACFRVSEDRLRGVIAVPMDIDPGDYPVQIGFPNRLEMASLRVVGREFDRSELQVGKQFTEKKTPALLARLQEEERQLRALFEPEPGPWRFSGKIHRPVPGEVTAVFGTRRIFNGKLGSVHYGLDLDARTGDPIHAAAAGRVVMSSMRWASGGTIIIDHGGGLFTAYFHMSQRMRNPGRIVKAGELLGLAGKTGRVTGPHLHLAILVRARKIGAPRGKGTRSFFVEPARFLDLDFRAESAAPNTGGTGAQAISRE